MDRNLIEAKIIADSKNEFGQRISSLILTYPRIIHAELLTHRVFSRSAASSRAIPTSKMLQLIEDEPFIPMHFQKEHKGMQGTEIMGINEDAIAAGLWLEARDSAIYHAKRMLEFGITKQIVNRVLEPYQMYQSIVTATEWENFTNLRVSEFAEDHFQFLAGNILDSLNASEPKQLKAGEWHIPFGDRFNNDDLVTWHYEVLYKDGPNSPALDLQKLKVKLATVRCARISYLNQGKESSIEDDLKLHDRLASSGHWSSMEHCARTMNETEYEEHSYTFVNQQTGMMDTTFGVCGNFTGFIQYRKMFADENRKDSRLIKK